MRSPLLLSLPLLLVACVVPAELDPGAVGGGGETVPQAPRPWTPAFRQASLVIADRVHIEGPKGLLDHVATRAEDGFHSYEAETLPKGFEQRFRVLEPESGVELRAWLDNVEIVAMRELVVLERPGELDVLLRATGDAYWRDLESGAERRGPELRFTGPIEPVPEPGTPSGDAPK